MCPWPNFSGTPVPKFIVPGDTMSLHSYIPVIMHYTLRIRSCKLSGMYRCRDIVLTGRFIWGTMGSRKFVSGHIVSGRPVTPPIRFVILTESVLAGRLSYPPRPDCRVQNTGGWSSERDRAPGTSHSGSLTVHRHCKYRFGHFPSSAGMSLTKLSLAGNNVPNPSPWKVWSK